MQATYFNLHGFNRPSRWGSSHLKFRDHRMVVMKRESGDLNTNVFAPCDFGF